MSVVTVRTNEKRINISRVRTKFLLSIIITKNSWEKVRMFQKYNEERQFEDEEQMEYLNELLD